MQNTISRPVEEGPSVRQHAQGPNEDAQRFYNLLKDAEQPLYEGFTSFIPFAHVTFLELLKAYSQLQSASEAPEVPSYPHSLLRHSHEAYKAS
ncbi:hypothetical protein FCV25MIE_19903 [Fagus crenata]